jgi:hypothetical protein
MVYDDKLYAIDVFQVSGNHVSNSMVSWYYESLQEYRALSKFA